MTEHVRHILVLPDRDAAEEVSDALAERFGADPEDTQLVREALAGEDDAEDAQWLVVLEDGGASHDPETLHGLAEEHEGWLERD
ncbi:hypothetical protein [Streptomyces sp. TR06-5]|uniref:hypothetical protein n=1 Tax=unclassified Streptomyces TaxID=2593676 RepID=UPI0039A33A01